MTIVVFLVAALLLFCVWSFSIHKGLKNLSCTRKFSKPAVFEGDEGELIEVVRNDRSVVIPSLVVESRISPHLRFGRQDNLHVSGEMFYCSQFALMPHQQIRRRHRVRFMHRGSYDLGNASLTASDVLGVAKHQRTQELSAPVVVYPRLLDDSEIPLPLSRMLGEISRRPQLLFDPFLVRGLRPYQMGDPVRDIHWPATARTGDVQVRIHDYSARTKLLVVLNAQYQELQWNDILPPEFEEKLENAIRMAATACVTTLRNGLSAGFATNMPMDSINQDTVLLPNDGEAWEETLLTSFARLKLRRTQHFPALLQSLTELSGMDFLILSCYDSETIQQTIQELKEKGNQVTFHLFEGGRR